MECRTKKITDTGTGTNRKDGRPGSGPGKFMKCRTDSDEKTVNFGPPRARNKTILGPNRTGTEILSRS